MNEDSIVCGNPLGPRVLSVMPMDEHKLFLTFDNGEKRIFDAKPLLTHGVFKRLKDKRFFDLVKVDHGTILWPQDIEYCPDTLYAESVDANVNPLKR